MSQGSQAHYNQLGINRKIPFAQTQGVSKTPYIPPPESMSLFWAPSRVDAIFAPKWFLNQLHAMDPDLTITWDRYNERWLVWMKSPRSQNKFSQGWTLLFPVRYADGSYMPLDERLFARLYAASAAKWGRGRDYFLAIEREMERDKEKAKLDRDSNVQHAAGEYYDHMKIQVSGCGPSNGSKFANHFSG